MDWDFIQANILLVVLALVSGGMLLWTFIQGSVGRRINVTDATLLINRENANILDVRESNEYADGHIAAARNMPVGQLANHLNEIDKWKEKPLILYCNSGVRASKAAGVLKKHGFASLHVLNNGVSAWKEAGLPLEKGSKRR